MGLGDVRFEEGDVVGTPVAEAARLVEAAQPGQILATLAMRRRGTRLMWRLTVWRCTRT